MQVAHIDPDYFKSVMPEWPGLVAADRQNGTKQAGHVFSIPTCFVTCMGFVWGLNGVRLNDVYMGFIWGLNFVCFGFYGVCMEFVWCLYAVCMGFVNLTLRLHLILTYMKVPWRIKNLGSFRR